jgi:hypothetical protein
MSDCPQSPQNLAVGLTSTPHLGQACANLAPHSSQNFFPSGFSNPQLRHCMLPLYSFGRARARKTLPVLFENRPPPAR